MIQRSGWAWLWFALRVKKYFYMEEPIMKHNVIRLTVVILVLAALLVGCGESQTPATTDAPAKTEAPVQTTAAPESVDVEALYEAGMAKIKGEQGDELVLFPETDPQFLEELFPGLTSIDMAQFKLALSPVTNGPVEVDIVEVKNAEDVQKVIDIFQARVDSLSEDDTYPENAAAWKNNSRITSRGNLVILAVLTDYYGEIPAEFILD